MPLQKNDFVEVEFTAKTEDGNVFDSNIAEELKKLNPEAVAEPFVFALGQGMFLKGVDDFLLGKEIGKYNIEVSPENAFGIRSPELIRTMPMSAFRQHQINPVRGAMFNFDGRVAKIISVSGGRVIADFNHPLAGKPVIYDINILRKLDDMNEKIKAFSNFLFRQDIPFEITKEKIILQVEKQLLDFVKLFEEKFKDLFGLGLEVQEVVEDATKKEGMKEVGENKNDDRSSKD